LNFGLRPALWLAAPPQVIPAPDVFSLTCFARVGGTLSAIIADAQPCPDSINIDGLNGVHNDIIWNGDDRWAKSITVGGISCPLEIFCSSTFNGCEQWFFSVQGAHFQAHFHGVAGSPEAGCPANQFGTPVPNEFTLALCGPHPSAYGGTVTVMI